jgi:hypothetical protein
VVKSLVDANLQDVANDVKKENPKYFSMNKKYDKDT